MKKVIALNNGFENERGKLIVEGREYEVLSENGNSYRVKDNQGQVKNYPKVIFKEVVDEVVEETPMYNKKKNKKSVEETNTESDE